MKYSGGKIFPHGIITALVTPFDDFGIDYGALKQLLEYHIGHGAEAVVLLGTTGEAPTVSDSERAKLIDFSKNIIGEKMFLIVGCGSNDTSKATKQSKQARALGADGILVSSPYYNKPNEKGMIQHYLSIAESSDLPIMLYNVPSRTGVNISPSCAEILLSHENITALKEAGADFSDITEKLIRLKDYDIFCGNDLFLPYFLSLGSCGIVSVASNVCFDEMNEIYTSNKNIGACESGKKFEKIYPFLKALTKDTNPILIKAVMAELGLIKPKLRLPLTNADASAVRDIMYAYAQSNIKR